MSGLLRVATEVEDVDVVPLVYLHLVPTGPSTTEAFGHVVDRIVAALRREGPFDGVLCALHGSAVCESVPDADGELLRRVREVVGPSTPVGAVLDMHANVSAQMVAHADVITAYQTNPHVDASDRGLECAALVAAAARGEIRPRLVVVAIPAAIDILRQGTDDEPLATILRLADECAGSSRTAGARRLLGIPLRRRGRDGHVRARRGRCGPRPGGFRSRGRRGAHLAPPARHGRRGLDVEEAVDRATGATGDGPTVLLDTGDNVPGGSPGDSTVLLHAARAARLPGVVSLVCDPDAVRVCARAGVGGRVDLEVGGRGDPAWFPLRVRGVVQALSDGRFEDPTPTHGGVRFFDMGETVRLTTDDRLDLVITSRPEGTVSLEQLRLVGLEPREQSVIVAKGVHSPRAAFGPIAGAMLAVATPGPTSADLTSFDFRSRRRPMFPFEADTTWSADADLDTALGVVHRVPQPGGTVTVTTKSALEAPTTAPTIDSDEQLDELLSRPTDRVRQALAAVDGDLVVLGAAGKMGPSLARMARRALDELGSSSRVVAVSRFSWQPTRVFTDHGIDVVSADLLDRDAVAAAAGRPQRGVHGRDEVREQRQSAADLGGQHLPADPGLRAVRRGRGSWPFRPATSTRCLRSPWAARTSSTSRSRWGSTP